MFQNGSIWAIYIESINYSPYIYFPISQILEILKIEGISIEECDRLMANNDEIFFNKVVLLIETDSNENVVYSKWYNDFDIKGISIPMIQVEIKK